MRLSEYYAAGIHSFFVGYALDAIEEHENPPPSSERYRIRYADNDRDFENDGNCGGCSCHLLAPCHHCENNHGEDEGGCS